MSTGMYALVSGLWEISNNVLGLQQLTFAVMWDHYFTPVLTILICSNFFVRYVSRLRKKDAKVKDVHVKAAPWRQQQHELNVKSTKEHGKCSPLRPASPKTPPRTPPSPVCAPRGLEVPSWRKVTMTIPGIARRTGEQADKDVAESPMSEKPSPHPWRKSTSTPQSEPSTPQSMVARRFVTPDSTPASRRVGREGRCSAEKFSSSNTVVSAPLSPEASQALKALALGTCNKDWEVALKSLVTAKMEGVQILDRTWSTVLTGCVSLGIMGVAEQILEPVLSSLPVIGYNILMKAHVKNSVPKKCIDLYSKMLANGIEPSSFTCGILLDAHVGNHDVDKAMALLRDMQSFKACGRPNSVHYTTILKGLIKAQRIHDAVDFFKEIPQPDVVTYSTLIKAHCDVGMVNEAVDLLKNMENVGVMPDDIVFNTLLSTCSRTKNLALGHKLFGQMMQLSVIPSNTTLEHLVRLYYKTFRPDLAADLLEKVSQHKFPLSGQILENPPKAYLDLLRSCIQQGRSEEAWRMYDVMAKHVSSEHNNTLQSILKLFQEAKADTTRKADRVAKDCKAQKHGGSGRASPSTPTRAQ